MKRYRFWMLGAFILVSAALVGATIKARQNPLYQLSRYSSTRAAKNYVFALSTEMENPLIGVGSVLINIHEVTSAGFEKVLEYQVTPGGQFHLNWREYGSTSTSHGRTANMNQRQLARIKMLVAQLPPSEPPIKSENLLVVLLYQPQPTQLRFYDRRHPPQQIREIVGILTGIVKKENRLLLPNQPPMDDVPHLHSKLRPLNSQDAVN